MTLAIRRSSLCVSLTLCVITGCTTTISVPSLKGGQPYAEVTRTPHTLKSDTLCSRLITKLEFDYGDGFVSPEKTGGEIAKSLFYPGGVFSPWGTCRAPSGSAKLRATIAWAEYELWTGVSSEVGMGGATIVTSGTQLRVIRTGQYQQVYSVSLQAPEKYIATPWAEDRLLSLSEYSQLAAKLHLKVLSGEAAAWHGLFEGDSSSPPCR